ncbi:MAG: thermonuclease family protein [Alphaproteobacteria bacterium]|nr:thermonuclease family protein [Alphaproteobacteria bacterium]
MTWYAIRLAVLALLLTGHALAANPEARVLDGDTIKIGKVNYRLHGIDAPEKAQRCQRDNLDWLCGQEAAAHLRRLIGGRPVTCIEKDRDRYGRVVAVCHAGGEDLNRAMVRAGLAWAYLAYSRDYEAAEWEAQLLGNGVWAPSVQAEPAWDWRRQRRAKPANDNATNPARIRG